MKKSLLLSFFAAGVIAANAQITINQNDMPGIGQTTVDIIDNTLSGISVGTAGTNQTWDLSNLQNNTTDTSVFLAPSSTPSGAMFATTANLAVYKPVDTSYVYLNSSASSLTIVGFAKAPATIKFNPVLEQMAFPSTYNTSFLSTGSFTTTQYYHDTLNAGPPATTVDSVRYTQTIQRTSLVDGWGSTITPAATYNSLRQHIIDTTTTKVEIYVLYGGFPLGWQTFQSTKNTTHTYDYVANGKGAVAEITTDSLGQVTDAKYLSVIVTDINTLTKADNISVYPNPAQDEVNIAADASKAAFIQIYDVMGKTAGIFAVTNNITNVNTAAFANGSYMFTIIGKDKTSVLSRGKFTIAK